MTHTTLALLVSLSLLAGCGGSSGDSNNPDVAQPQVDAPNPFEPVSESADIPPPEPTPPPESDAPTPAPPASVVEAPPEPDTAPVPNEGDDFNGSEPVAPTTTADDAPIAMLPPLNESSDLVQLLDRTDMDCSLSIASATEMYGDQSARENEFFPDDFGGGIMLSTLLWSGIETEMQFRSGDALDGCLITYSRGGPSIGVSAIETTPDPVLPASTAESAVAAATGERVTVPDDPECVATFVAMGERLGPPDNATTFGPETGDDGTTLVLLGWNSPQFGGTLNYGPNINGCLMTLFPIV